MVTAFAPGSGPDAVLRLVAEKLGKAWNQRVLVENRPGGGGFIAIDAVKRAAPDGYTLLQLDSEHLAALPHLYKARGFETLKTFEPVAALFRTNFLIAVQTESRLKSMSDLVAAAKAQPGRVSYGSWGVGSPAHLGAEQLELATGIDMQHVPFRDVSQLFTAIGGGDVQWSFGTLPSSQGAYKAGKIRYIAVAAPKRLAQMPEVPTVAEAGGPASLEVNSFVVLVAPRGLPAAVRERIHADVAQGARRGRHQGTLRHLRLRERRLVAGGDRAPGGDQVAYLRRAGQPQEHQPGVSDAARRGAARAAAFSRRRRPAARAPRGPAARGCVP